MTTGLHSASATILGQRFSDLIQVMVYGVRQLGTDIQVCITGMVALPLPVIGPF